MPEKAPLFTPRFFVMCGFSFTVFASAFLLLPTAPFRILRLGGSESTAGLFLGLLTYASAGAAPLMGAVADRVGKARMLLACSLAIAGFSAAYAFAGSYRLLLALVPFHGVFWAGLLSASAAYVTDILPEARRAEGIGYWGLSTILAIAVAPSLGFALFERGWGTLCAACCLLNLVMAAIAAALIDEPAAAGTRLPHRGPLVEWRVLGISFTLFLYSFGYGGITSFVALYAESYGVAPKSLYFTALALVIALTRPVSAPLADRIGHRKVFLPCLVLIAVGLAVLAWSGTRPWLLLSALIFGVGFGTAYPVYVAYVMRHVAPERRGAAFGGVLAAFDIGIGTGSIGTGWQIDHFGFRTAYATAALLSTLSIPYFLWAERRFLTGQVAKVAAATLIISVWILTVSAVRSA